MFGKRVTDATIAAHDLQRQLSPAAEGALIEGLRARLEGRGRCLDAGVGTGAVARPLARTGIPMVGVDVSRPMLDALVTKSGGRAPFPLVRADLVRLPFGNRAFGGAVAANVFHLIADWREAVAELVRVVRPDGLLLVNLGGSDRSELGVALRTRFRDYLGGEHVPEAETAGLRTPADFEACLDRYGVASLAPLEVRDRQTRTLEQMIARLEHNVFAWGSRVDVAALSAAAAATRTWAERHLGPLDAPHSSERTITYRVYRVSARSPATPDNYWGDSGLSRRAQTK